MSKQNFHDPITLEEIADIKYQSKYGHLIFVPYKIRQAGTTAAEATQVLKQAAKAVASAMTLPEKFMKPNKREMTRHEFRTQHLTEPEQKHRNE